MPDGGGARRSLSAEEVAERLGVRLAPLYACVSPGRLRSELDPHGAQASPYAAADVERLLERAKVRRTPEVGARGALSFGGPVLIRQCGDQLVNRLRVGRITGGPSDPMDAIPFSLFASDSWDASS